MDSRDQEFDECIREGMDACASGDMDDARECAKDALSIIGEVLREQEEKEALNG